MSPERFERFKRFWMARRLSMWLQLRRDGLAEEEPPPPPRPVEARSRPCVVCGRRGCSGHCFQMEIYPRARPDTPRHYAAWRREVDHSRREGRWPSTSVLHEVDEQIRRRRALLLE